MIVLLVPEGITTSSLLALQPCVGLGLVHGFITVHFLRGWVISSMPNPQPGG
jgi:hypothetical protein